MKRSFIPFTVVIALLAFVAACSKSTDKFETALSTDYFMPLQVGKYITYRLDTTKFVNFGQKDSIVSCQAKDVVEEFITDNLGRPAWRIVRYTRPVNSTNEADWTPANTFTAVYSNHVLEMVQDNMRYILLHEPVREGYSWPGNSYLPYSPFTDQYDFSNDEDIQQWEYSYQDVGASVTINNKDYDSTLTVVQIADSNNVPIVFPDGIAYNNYWVEKYAKNIGLIYKQVIMWEYQPENNNKPAFKTGFGVMQTIIDHN